MALLVVMVDILNFHQEVLFNNIFTVKELNLQNSIYEATNDNILSVKEIKVISVI